MKSYFLAPISSGSEAEAALSELLPEENVSWLLKDDRGDVVAYFSIVEHDSTTGLRTIQVDVSGRHYYEDQRVVAVLEKLQSSIGGHITNDNGEYVNGVA